MTRQEFENYKDTVLSMPIQFTGTRYWSKAHYDSMRAAGLKRHNWLQRQFVYREIEIQQKYKNDKVALGKAFKSALVHSIPQMLFISLPLLALILKLLYVRRKQFYYVSHGIFGLHFYIFVFIAMLFMFALSALNGYLNSGLITLLIVLLAIWLFIYEFLAMKNFYKQGWLKTFAKFLLLNFLFMIVVGLLFVVFVFFSLFKI
jgi:hypothetical protein